MGSPKNSSRHIIPEFEEEVEGISDSKFATKEMSSSSFLEDVKQLREIQEEFNQWGISTFEKKKVPRSDYDDFTALCTKFAIVIERAEIRHKTQSSASVDLAAKVEKLQESVNKLSFEITKGQNKPSSFAEVVQLPGRKREEKEEQLKSNTIKIKKPIMKEKIVIVKPKAIVGSEKQTREKVMKTLKASLTEENNLKIKKAVGVRGGGVLLVMDSNEDKNRILGEEILSNPNLKVSEPQKFLPKLIVYDVPAGLGPHELTKEIYNRNFRNSFSQENFIKEFKPSFKVGPRGKEHVHWVVECSPGLRKDIINRLRLYIAWVSCRVKDYVAISRCFKCQGLGHVGKYCKKEQNICGHCACEGHEVKNCPKIMERPICINCKNQKSSDTHKVSDKNCPAYVKAMQQLIDKTDYGF